MKLPDMQLPDFTEMLKKLHIPGVDMDALVASRRKDIEALVAANQRAQESFKALVQRQTEMLQEAISKAQSHAQDSSMGQSLTDAATRQAENAKKAIEQALGSMREMADMATKSHTQAYEAMQKRMHEGFEKARDLLHPKK